MNDNARIELLEARAHIADLIHRYAKNIRTGNREDCAALFTGNATFEVREAVPGDANSVRTRTTLQGREAILKYLNQTGAGGGNVCPLISNLLIDVQGHEAQSNCMMTAIVWASGQRLLGEYLDSFRYDGVWRFTARIYTILGSHS